MARLTSEVGSADLASEFVRRTGIVHGSIELHIRDGHLVAYSTHEKGTVRDSVE